MTSKHAPTSIVAQSTHSTSPTIGITNAANWSRTFWRDLAIFLVAAIGLAYGYNELNPKHIKWVRTVYTRDTLVSTPAAMSATMSDTTRTDSTTQPSGISASLKMSARDSSLAAKRLADSLITSKARALKNGVDTAKLTPSAPCFVAESGVVKEISYGQFVTFIKMPCVTLIDARIPESYQKGHIRNAANINGTEAESPDVIQRLIKFERDKIIVIYCDGGECELSHRVADVLKNFGYGPIYIYTGGWAEWTKKNP
ncbi:MAG: rhodanese-like domain-containing protein [bacterium]|nr:rhodanese-like domain-containing protein [bacterium]